MTNNDFLESLLAERDLLYNNITIASQLRVGMDFDKTVEKYIILNSFCRNLSWLIKNGTLDGKAERDKTPMPELLHSLH